MVCPRCSGPPKIISLIGDRAVLDLEALKHEINVLAAAGIQCPGRLLISDRYHLIFDCRRALETADETRRGTRRIGTTHRGIGPAYEDKTGRRGLLSGVFCISIRIPLSYNG